MLYREKKKDAIASFLWIGGQSQILVTLVPFLNVDATKLIKIGKSLITSGKKRTGQSQILDTHTSLLNVDDICSIKIVKQLIMGG